MQAWYKIRQEVQYLLWRWQQFFFIHRTFLSKVPFLWMFERFDQTFNLLTDNTLKMHWWNDQSLCPIIMWNWLEIFKIWLGNIWWSTDYYFQQYVPHWFSLLLSCSTYCGCTVQFWINDSQWHSSHWQEWQMKSLRVPVSDLNHFVLFQIHNSYWWSLYCRYDITLKLYLQMTSTILSFEEFWSHRWLSYKRGIFEGINTPCNHSLWAQDLISNL